VITLFVSFRSRHVLFSRSFYSNTRLRVPLFLLLRCFFFFPTKDAVVYWILYLSRVPTFFFPKLLILILPQPSFFLSGPVGIGPSLPSCFVPPDPILPTPSHARSLPHSASRPALFTHPGLPHPQGSPPPIMATQGFSPFRL